MQTHQKVMQKSLSAKIYLGSIQGSGYQPMIPGIPNRATSASFIRISETALL
jgi:hypothetical protein